MKTGIVLFTIFIPQIIETTNDDDIEIKLEIINDK